MGSMSTVYNPFDQEQICYVQCGNCTTILLVSVPFNCLLAKVVTVRCGYCTSLLSVNLSKASFLPFHLLASPNHDEPKQEILHEEKTAKEGNLEELSNNMMVSSDDEGGEEDMPINHVVKKPPEKKCRAPSAYNCFVKEEIRRLKAMDPNMSHKQAFSTAAKNWAQFPPKEQREKGEKRNMNVAEEFPA